MLTSKEKAWFFLTGGYQPKINKLIFLVIFLVQSAKYNDCMRFVMNLTPGMTGRVFWQ
ncbi:hypothetical protein LNQ52_21770 [Klebsiella pneumoniae subsp. pneumoniae]|nr:hypothetical protein [Klebsiella pneumoniae subsp. pneumoniae]